MRKRKTCQVEPIFEEYDPELDVPSDGEPLKRKKVIKTTKKISVSVFILIFLALIGGFAYTWYTGRDYSAVEVGVTKNVAAATDAFSTPTQQSDNVNVGVAIQSIDSPVKPGSTASVSVKTNTKVNCTIKVVYNGIQAEDSGLLPKKSDEYGTVSWTWLVPSTTPVGKWPVTITCANSTKSGVAGDALVVSNSI